MELCKYKYALMAEGCVQILTYKHKERVALGKKFGPFSQWDSKLQVIFLPQLF